MPLRTFLAFLKERIQPANNFAGGHPLGDYGVRAGTKTKRRGCKFAASSFVHVAVAYL